MIERYLKAEWSRDGMEYPRLNCWGLVRLVRHELYGLPLLPAFGIAAQDKRSLTRACHAVVAAHLVECQPCKGAIAAVWRGALCVHVAAVIELDGRLAVLEVDEGKPAGWRWLQDFERDHIKITYYKDA